MPNYTTFTDLPIWQEARRLTKSIYELSNSREFSKDIGLKGQIQRASVSIMSNIAEGFERRSNAEFINFLNYAKASAGEVRSQLFVALDVGYVSPEEQKQLDEDLERLGSQIGGFIKYLSDNKR